MGRTLEFDFKTTRRDGIGTLRSYVREQGKKHLGGKEVDEKKFFKELRF
jgi:hypothetical protein